MSKARQFWTVGASLEPRPPSEEAARLVCALLEECGADRLHLVRAQLQSAGKALESPSNYQEGAAQLISALRNMGVYLKAGER